MNRRFWMCAIIVCLVPVSIYVFLAQPPEDEKKEEEKPDPIPQVEIRPAPEIQLFPAGVPNPLGRYRLEVEYHTRKPGDTLEIFKTPRKERVDKFKEENPWLVEGPETWTTPLAQLPPEMEKLRTWDVLKELDEAAALSTADWRKITFELTNPLPEEFSRFRELAVFLRFRGRVELKDGDFPAVVKTASTMLTMARVMGEGPNLIHHLVGVAVGNCAFDLILEGMRTPGFPNLYWAWQALPERGISLRRSFEGEAYQVDSIFPGLREMIVSGKIRKLPDAELTEMVENVIAMMDDAKKFPFPLPGAKKKESGGLGEMWEKAKVRKQLANLGPASRQDLIARGFVKADVEGISDIQAALLGEVANWEDVIEEFCKWADFPAHIGRPELEKYLGKMKQGKKPESVLQRGFLITHDSFMGSTADQFMRLYRVNYQLNRFFKAIQVMEAMRLHAATTGAWPSTLNEIRVVPVPNDPSTGKPFLYNRNGKNATLETESLDQGVRMHHKWELVLEGAK